MPVKNRTKTISKVQANINITIQSIINKALSIFPPAQKQNLASEKNPFIQVIEYLSQVLSENIDKAYGQAKELDALGAEIHVQLSDFRI